MHPRAHRPYIDGQVSGSEWNSRYIGLTWLAAPRVEHRDGPVLANTARTLGGRAMRLLWWKVRGVGLIRFHGPCVESVQERVHARARGPRQSCVLAAVRRRTHRVRLSRHHYHRVERAFGRHYSQAHRASFAHQRHAD